MPLEQIASKDEIVCFLIVNYIPLLPLLSIGSCLSATDTPIVVGYINEDDLRDLPASPRITRLDLNQVARCRKVLSGVHSGAYKHFGSQDFFNLVQLKWHLFAELLESKFQRIIYSDIDTIWIQDAVTLTRMGMVNSLIQIQDVSVDVRNPKLCMGFISIVNDPKTVKLIEDCAVDNELRLLSGEQIGDDDIITDYFRNQGFPTWIRPLPQLSFPTGNMLTQYIAKSSFRPVEPPRPILFHANYIIGQKNKAIVLERVSRRMKMQITDEIPISSLLSLKLSFFLYWTKFWYMRLGRALHQILFAALGKKGN